MCIIQQRCSICELNFDRFSKSCPSECHQHAQATSNEHSKCLEKDDDWCQGIGIICFKCSSLTEGKASTPITKARQDGDWKRMLRKKLMDKKREAEEARLEADETPEVRQPGMIRCGRRHT